VKKPVQSIITSNKLHIIFEERDAETANSLQSVCEKTGEILSTKWDLSLPGGTQVHLMRSWLSFPFKASALPRRFLLAISLPIWAYKARKMWVYTGGWTLPYPHQPAIGIKPPDLLRSSDRSMGRRIFVDTMDDASKVRMITCHELTHASTAFLKLPAWLNEGMAMVAVDTLFGYESVKKSTLTSLRQTQPTISPRGYRQLHRADKQALIYLYVRGYWITRFFDSEYPDVLKNILIKRHKHKTISTKLANVIQIPAEDFWQRIDAIVANHFESVVN
jgi:hypothetical protein